MHIVTEKNQLLNELVRLETIRKLDTPETLKWGYIQLLSVAKLYYKWNA